MGKDSPPDNDLRGQQSQELARHLDDHGFTQKELDGIVRHFREVRPHLQDNEWVDREGFQEFFGVREKEFANMLFDSFKQRHQVHDHNKNDCISRESHDGTKDEINLREFLCGLVLLQSDSLHTKLQLLFNLYNPDGGNITREEMSQMLKVSMRENKLNLSEDVLNTVTDRIFEKMDVNSDNTISFEEFEATFLEFPQEMQKLTLQRGAHTADTGDFFVYDRDLVPKHPDFIKDEYEDETSSKRDQKRFETIDYENIAPLEEMDHDSKSKRMDFKTRLITKGPTIATLTLYALINIGFFAWNFIKFAVDDTLIDVIGWGLPFSRGFAQVLKFNTAFILLTVSRNLLTFLRGFLYKVVPLDQNIRYHKMMAGVILVASVGHWAAHYVNFHNISSATLPQLQSVNPEFFTSVPSFARVALGTYAGATGHHILGAYEYWKWFIGPAAIYVCERLIRLYRQERYTVQSYARILPERALTLEMPISSHFKYKAGQYVFLNCPDISRTEWHPFTLTSSPEEEMISVHIRAAGNWTKRLYSVVDPNDPISHKDKRNKRKDWKERFKKNRKEGEGNKGKMKVKMQHLKEKVKSKREGEEEGKREGKGGEGKEKGREGESKDKSKGKERQEDENARNNESGENGNRQDNESERGNNESERGDNESERGDRENTQEDNEKEIERESSQAPVPDVASSPKLNPPTPNNEAESSSAQQRETNEETNEEQNRENESDEDQEEDDEEEKDEDDMESQNSQVMRIKMRVDGPYGSASEHVFHYEHVIMIGAGIGVTPYASVLKHILYKLENSSSLRLKKVHFFWTCREQGAFQWFADVLSHLETHESAKKVLSINTFLTGALARHDVRSILLWYGLQQEFAKNRRDLVTGLSNRTYWGRPNFDNIIKYIFAKYRGEKIGIFYCGPPALSNDILSFAKKHSADLHTRFRFHEEQF